MRVRERLKDTDGLTEVLQVPVDGPQTVPQLIGAPVQLVTTHLRTRQSTDTHLLQIRCKHCAQTLCEQLFTPTTEFYNFVIAENLACGR